MKPIAIADHLKVYHIKHDINDYIYFRFCKGKMKKAKIRYELDDNYELQPYFLVENTLRYYLNEIVKLNS
jgi:hypothetical protein